MYKKWLYGVVVWVLCMTCLLGSCVAAEQKENWVEYARGTRDVFHVDTNSLHATEYNGRKYLDMRSKMVNFNSKKTLFEWHQLIDIAQGKMATLYFKQRNKKPYQADVATALTVNSHDDVDDIVENILENVARYNPELVDEIMSYNHDTSLRSPIGGVAYYITRNTSGVGGAYKLLSEDGLNGLTFDYRPESNLFVLYNLNESTPYSSQRYSHGKIMPNDYMVRNSTDMHDKWNGNYQRNYGTRVFEKVGDTGYTIYKWETDALLTFLRTRAWLHLQ
ncbi:hypothetical protein [Anaerovibrio lipolyticus]|uniref:hypothetical protein n=1 Tax=Anaerovibrio lipolyticus TaxID=82374 RepID=UPI0023F22EBF|nr:hypothetical protein [Anaerovibrio lipolyticus]